MVQHLKDIVKNPGSGWREYLNSPIWYVAIVTILAVLTLNVRFLWWLAGVVALAWGTWLVWQLFAQDKKQSDITDQLEVYLDQTLAYQAQIGQLLKDTSNGSNGAHRGHLAAQIDIWTREIQNLIRHISGLRRDNLVWQDIAAVPKAIEALETQLEFASDPAIRAQLEHTLINRQNQLAALQMLQTNITQAEIQIESTLSLLGTIYSQLLIGRSSNHVADYSRLSVDVDEEVHRLQDQLEALWEVKGAYWLGTASRITKLSDSASPLELANHERL